MTPIEVEAAIRMLNGRVDRIEQLLPTLATKQGLDDLRLATRQDLDALRLATKQDLDALRLATKQDLVDLEARLCTQMGVLHEDVKGDIRLLAEHLARVIERPRSN